MEKIISPKTGLTLGKFAPLHKGHQLLIETAISEMDEVIVIIYDCPEIISVPLNIRSEWLRTLYPNIEIIEAWDGPLEVGNTPEIKKMHEDYILNILKGRRITHFYSSEFYGEHMSIALNAVNRIVDYNRDNFNISGTQIRENPYLYREYIHPAVYRDLITNIVFLGAPSTGKTTIAQKIAQEYQTVWMPEYGREYWEKHQENRRLTLHQLVEIAEGHLIREDALLHEADKYLFTDTNAITTYIFSLYYHDAADERLKSLAIQAESRYDIFFVCDIDIPYDDTWDRSGDANRLIFQKQIIADLLKRKIPFFILRGNLKERIEYVKRILGAYHKYKNILDIFSSSFYSMDDCTTN